VRNTFAKWYHHRALLHRAVDVDNFGGVQFTNRLDGGGSHKNKPGAGDGVALRQGGL
jgi:hypothetical protein